MTTKKHPSAQVKPANQKVKYALCLLFNSHCLVGVALNTGTISGKLDLSSGEIPRFIDALIATILRKPFSVKCSFSWINLKSEHFLVIKGYILKWLITVSNSFNDWTFNWIAWDTCLKILPTPKCFWITCIALSLTCTTILNLCWTYHPWLNFLFSVIDTSKQPSPSGGGSLRARRSPPAPPNSHHSLLLWSGLGDSQWGDYEKQWLINPPPMAHGAIIFFIKKIIWWHAMGGGGSSWKLSTEGRGVASVE